MYTSLLAVALPMEEAAQQAIAAAAHLAHPFETRLIGTPISTSACEAQHHAGLKRFPATSAAPALHQAFRVGVVVGTHNNREIGFPVHAPDAGCAPQHAHRQGHDQYACPA